MMNQPPKYISYFQIDILFQLYNKLINMETRLTRFEKVRILGYRAKILSMGAPPMVDITGMTCALAIAEKEYAMGRIPLNWTRKYPNGDIKTFSFMDDTTIKPPL